MDKAKLTKWTQATFEMQQDYMSGDEEVISIIELLIAPLQLEIRTRLMGRFIKGDKANDKLI